MSGVENFCKGCIYYGKLSGIPCCLYCYITGHSRRCPAGAGCNKRAVERRIPTGIVEAFPNDVQKRKETGNKRELADRNRATLQGRQKAAITEFRIAQGWTVKEMAMRMGIKESTFKKWITEYSKANWDVLATVGLSKPDGLP